MHRISDSPHSWCSPWCRCRAGRGLAWVGGSVLAADAVLATVYTGVIAVALRRTVDTPAGQASAS